jgi:amino acid adenylation domain-containing protein
VSAPLDGVSGRVAPPAAAGRQPQRELSRQEKLALLEREARRRARAGRSYQLSFAQRRLWFLDRLDPGSPASNVFRAFTLAGPLAAAALGRALAEIVRRHEALRTTFPIAPPPLDEPRQRVAPGTGTPDLPLIDLGGLPAAGRRAQAAELARREARRVFDLARGPLLRTRLVRLDREEHVLLLTLHHVAGDGWSLGLLLGELSALYPVLAAGLPSPLPEPALQYPDFAVWQRAHMAGPRLRAELDWWREQIGDTATVLELPADRPRPARASWRGTIARVSVPAALAGELRALSREAGATLFMTLLAAFEALLGRITGQGGFLVGTTVAGRGRPELEAVVGTFANTLALTAAVAGDAAFRQLLLQVRAATVAAYGHQELPFDCLVEELQPERHLAHHPLYQVMLNLQNLPPAALALPGLAVAGLDVERGLSKLDLTLELIETGREIAGYLEYSTDLFEAPTIARMSGHLLTLLAGIATDPGRRVAELPLLGAAERHQLLVDWNPHGYEARPAVPALVAARARRAPDAPAVLFGDQVLSYGELDARANRLARALRRRGAGPDALIGLCLERSLDMAVALLAVLKAGAAYVPLDPAYPRERLALMLADTRMALALTAGAAAAPLAEAAAKAAVAPDRIAAPELEILNLDAAASLLAGEASGDPAWPIEPEGLAYVVYTSGSTGRPKGVGVPHRALANHAGECARRYQLDGDDRVLQFTSLSFDITSEEVFPTWIAGGAVVPRMPGLFPAFAELEALLARHRVTVVNLPTAYWHEWVSELYRTGRRSPAALRLVVIGTEQAHPERLAEWLELTGGPSAPDGRPRFANSYASTECTVTALIHLSGPASLARARAGCRIPVGRPIENCRVYVLDARGEPAPIGVPGDVYIGGANVSRGYLGQPERTAASFLPDPFAACGPGGRLYRQGDRGRFLPGGELECLGRSDDQVKVRGYRIEPGEIEAVLARHPVVRECIVLARDDGPAGRRLVGYVARDPRHGAALPDAALAEELQAFLREVLPDYMVPAGLVILAALPLTRNGKLDRRALLRIDPAREAGAPAAAPGAGTPGGAEPGAAEASPLAGVVAAIWEQVLGREVADHHANFFDLGGHSLLATRVVARLREALGVELPLRTLFEHPTAAGVAREAEAARRARSGLAPPPPLVPVSRDGPLPCSFAQQRLWVVDQLSPGSAAYNLGDALRWRGPLDVAALAGALHEIARRHEVLRTSFAVAAGQAVQRIAPAAARALLPLALVDLARVPGAEERLGGLLAADLARPFDLGRAPLARATLYRLGEADHVLLLCLHHIVSDGTSSGILLRELVTLYGALACGGPSPRPAGSRGLAPLPVQYADFAVWQRAWLAGAALAAQLDFWRRHLAGAPPAIALPTDRPRPPMESLRGARHRFAIPTGAGTLTALGRGAGATLFMTLLAAWDALLARWSGQDDVVVGWPIAGRGRPELEGLIGYLANILVHRVRIDAGKGFSRLLAEVREIALDAYTHGDLPFELLVGELRPERHLAHNPVFQVLFVLHRLDGRGSRLSRPPHVQGGHAARPGSRSRQVAADAAPAPGAAGPGAAVVSTLPVPHRSSLLDLSLAVSLSGDALEAFLEYKTALFDAPTVARMAGHLARLVAAAAASPEAPVAALALLSPAERHQLVTGCNDTATEVPAAATAHRLFEARAAASPAALALEHAGLALSYGELNARANRLAHRLRRLGAGPGTRVGICLERGAELVAALLAVLKSGAGYVPVDPGYPAERLAFIAADAGLRLLLATGAPGGLPPGFGGAAGSTVVELDDEQVRHELQAESAADPSPLAGALDVAYVLYTSGSTGRPKGVEVSHGSLANFLLAMAREPGLAAADALLAVTTVAFDIAALELYLPLAVGARIVLAGRAEAADAGRLAALLRGSGATAMQATPATWRMLLAAGWAGEPRLKALVGGEALPADLARQLGARVGEVWNLYGPTETTVWSAIHPVTGAGAAPAPPAAGTVPIGRPIANTTLHLLDRALQPVPLGVTGELYIGGAGLARGYHGRPELTAASFVPDPNGPAGARLYRSGDLARRLPRGEIEFLGRADHQVKVRGYRVEPGEIEAALGRHPAVRQAVVVVREESPGNAQLVAYVAAAGHAAGAGALRAALREELPEYMVPSLFVLLPELPLTPNGKVDRRALPPAGAVAGAAGGERVAPRTPVERQVAAVWSEVLGMDGLGVHDNFFDRGGHSLMATQVMARLQAIYGVELSLREIFEAPTVAGLSEAIMRRELEQADGAVLAELLAEIEA